MLTPAVKPLVRIALVFAIVWVYDAVTTGLVAGWQQVAVVVLLAIPTWVIVSRVVFATGDDDWPRLPGRREE